MTYERQAVRDAAVAITDLCGRSGATDFELGFVEDDVPVEEAGWWAKVNYNGTRMIVEDAAGPVEAADLLARRILEGGKCTHCGKTTTVDGPYLPTMRCRWRREGDRWKRGCE